MTAPSERGGAAKTTAERTTGHAERARPLLTRRNPTVKLGLLLAVSIAVSFVFDPLPVAICCLVALTAVRITAGVGWRRMSVGLVPFAVFGAGLIAVNALSRPGTALVEGPVRITTEGLSVGAALALRALLIGIATIGFLATTAPRDLMVSLTQHARVSPRFAYALLAGHRMLEAMPERWATIRAAHAVRAPLARSGRPRFGPRAFARCAFALLVASVRSSERTALALESRGLGDGPRTLHRPVPIEPADAALALAVLGTLAAVLALTALV